MDVGFEQAGFHGILSADIDALSVTVHNRNLKTPGHVIDLKTTDRKLLGVVNPDVVIAGPPCQGFSTLGKRRINDPRNSLIVAAAQHAVSLRPKVVLIENVSGVISGTLGEYWENALRVLRKGGFQTQTRHVVCSWFGVPQIRKRLLLVAWRGFRETFPPFPTIAATNLSTALDHLARQENHEPVELKRNSADYQIAQRISQHQKLCNVRGGNRAVPTWTIPEVFGRTSAEEREILCVIRQLRRKIRVRTNGDSDPLTLRDISHHCNNNVSGPINRLLQKGYLRKIGNRFDLVHTFNGKFRRLSWEHPAPAVDTRFGDPRYYLHPEEHRGLSVREAARIQGFPDEFVFGGPKAAQFRMVGNAVPPPLARQLAVSIREFLR